MTVCERAWMDASAEWFERDPNRGSLYYKLVLAREVSPQDPSPAAVEDDEERASIYDRLIVERGCTPGEHAAPCAECSRLSDHRRQQRLRPSPGTRVRYTTTTLVRMGLPATDEAWRRWGTIAEAPLDLPDVVTVLWGGWPAPVTIAPCNIVSAPDVNRIGDPLPYWPYSGER